MKIAVLSDLHSNRFALEAVLREVRVEQPELVLILGDIFGYYAWPVETYRLARGVSAVTIRGNHDELVLADSPPQPAPPYWPAAQHNRRELERRAPEALEWLSALPAMRSKFCAGLTLRLFHGTPDNPLDGRYYPDDTRIYPWFPGEREVLLLGHTHYPLVRESPAGGLIVNPGSVGQPRDGDVRACWGWLDTERLAFDLRRTCYDVDRAVEELRKLDWDERAVCALKKDYSGPLRGTS